MAILSTDNAYWLGKVPEDWRVSRIGDYYTLRNEKVSDVDYPPLSVTIKGVVPQLATAAKTDDHDNRKLVCKGDFAINSRSDRRGSCGISDYDGSVSLINTVLTPRGQMNPRYYNWLFHTEQFADEFYKWGHGIVDDLWTTRWQEMKSILIVSPPLVEQQAIADYLDERCSKIDEIIAEATASIEEYKELKQAVIYEAVTKGINILPSEHRKELDWADNVCLQWPIYQIRYLYRLRNEKNDLPLDKVNLISLYTDRGVIQHSDINKETITGNKAVTADGYKIVYPNDIVVNIILCWMGAMGISNYYGVTSPAYDIYEPIDTNMVNSRYYHYLFRTDRFAKKCYTLGRGIMMMRWRTYSSEFRSIKVPVPSIAEQNEIADYLDERTMQIDALIAEKQSLIDDLQAYKKSLIYEVVTGKRRVV